MSDDTPAFTAEAMNDLWAFSALLTRYFAMGISFHHSLKTVGKINTNKARRQSPPVNNQNKCVRDQRLNGVGELILASSNDDKAEPNGEQRSKSLRRR
jgi:hypothetical protein